MILVVITYSQKLRINVNASVSGSARGLNGGCLNILHTLYIQAAKALESLYISGNSPEPPLLDSVISTKVACSQAFIIFYFCFTSFFVLFNLCLCSIYFTLV